MLLLRRLESISEKNERACNCVSISFNFNSLARKAFIYISQDNLALRPFGFDLCSVSLHVSYFFSGIWILLQMRAIYAASGRISMCMIESTRFIQQQLQLMTQKMRGQLPRRQWQRSPISAAELNCLQDTNRVMLPHKDISISPPLVYTTYKQG